MSRTSWKVLAASCVITAIFGAMTTASAANSSGSEAARCDTYTAADGMTYFAISLPPVAAPAAPTHDVVVLFDTSAGQAGASRTRGLEILTALLQTLGDKDRVQ